MLKEYRIIIVGFGNLGSRYLEGLLKSNLNISVDIYDINYAKKNLQEHNDMKVFFHNTFNTLRFNNYDLLINATPSKDRYSLIKYFTDHFEIKYFVLEKVLSNNLQDLQDFQNLFDNNCWVNTFLRTLPIFQDLKNKLNNKNLIFNVSGGGWGLCCNSIHYIDLVSWLTGSKIETISTKKLSSVWFNSKRKGYKEVNGILIIKYEDGTFLNIECDDSDKNLKISLKGKNLIFEYDIISGNYVFNSKKGNKNIPYQSSMTCNLINQILVNGICKLTPLNESLNQHEIYIDSMIKHWNSSNQFNHIEVQIT